MIASTIQGRKVLFFYLEGSSIVTYSIDFYPCNSCRLTQDVLLVKGKWQLTQNSISISFPDSQIHINGIIDGDFITGDCIIKGIEQKNYSAIFFQKKDYGEIKAMIRLILYQIKIQTYTNTIDDWILQFPTKTRDYIFNELFDRLKEYAIHLNNNKSVFDRLLLYMHPKNKYKKIKQLFYKNRVFNSSLHEFSNIIEEYNPQLVKLITHHLELEKEKEAKKQQKLKRLEEIEKKRIAKIENEKKQKLISEKYEAAKKKPDQHIGYSNAPTIEEIEEYESNTNDDALINIKSSVSIQDISYKSLEYEFIFKYYPVRYEVSEDLKRTRQFIYEFKDGINTKNAADYFIKVINSTDLYDDWWLCIIPASTRLKSEIRFKNFCDYVCMKTRLNNGYSLITNRNDRDASHLQKDREIINRDETIRFGEVKGKKIILFDDVFTTGKSYKWTSNKLKQLGVRKVYGIFLSKTFWMDE